MNQKLGKRKRRLQEQAAPATAKAATSRRYFHGGRAGFKAILPPSVLRVVLPSVSAQDNGATNELSRRDRKQRYKSV